MKNLFKAKDPPEINILMQRNEEQSNKLSIAVCFGVSIILAFMAVSVLFLDTLVVSRFATLSFIGATAVFGFAICFVCKFCLKDSRLVMYVSMIGLVIVCAVMDWGVSYFVYLLIVFPILISCRYFSWKFTLKVGILTVVLSYLVAVINVSFHLGVIDLNAVMSARQVVLPPNTDLYQVVLDNGNVDWENYASFYLGVIQVNKSLFFALICGICTVLAAKGRQMICEQSEITKNIIKLDSEMQMAGRIQKSLITHEEGDNHDAMNRFDISTLMEPAKDVGGDFYDYFMPDANHLVITVADVSGKGISAGLFAVKTQTLIREEAKTSLNPEKIVTVVNKNLCENNTEVLFVTAWLGVIDLDTGVMKYVNAGHNPPLIMNKDTGYCYLSDEHNTVLGALETIEYFSNSLTLNPGDRVLLYTDGVTEAAKENGEMYGEKRFGALVNSNQSLCGDETIKDIREDIKSFTDGHEQSDDITILLCCYNGCKSEDR